MSWSVSYLWRDERIDDDDVDGMQHLTEYYAKPPHSLLYWCVFGRSGYRERRFGLFACAVVILIEYVIGDTAQLLPVHYIYYRLSSSV